MKYILFIALIFTGFAASAQTNKHHWLSDLFPYIKLKPGTNVTVDTATVADTLEITINAAGAGSAGNYSPTGTAVANVSAITGLAGQYLRVGNVVTVSGAIQITPTASATLTRARFTLPVTSAISSGNHIAGVAAGASGAGFALILGDATNDQAEIAFTSWGTAAVIFYYHFTYRVE